MKKLNLFLVVVLSISLVITGCSSKEPAAPADSSSTSGQAPTSSSGEPAKDTLVVAVGAEPSSLDGNGKNDNASLQVRYQLYETIVAQDIDMSIIPSIAESWEYVDDTTLVFKIREGVKFHNGDELKASDVAFSIKRGNELGFTSNYLSPIDFEKSGATGDYEYTLILKEPFAAILSNLTAGAAQIVPEKVVLEKGEDYLAKNPIGTGPYKLKQWVEGDRIELEKFDDYWRETKGVQNITMRIISEAASRAIEVEVGGVDIAYALSPNDALRLTDNPDVKVDRAADLSTTYIGFNYEKDLFKDKRVRQAVSYGLQLESIVDAVYFGLGQPGKNMIAPTVWGYTDNVKKIEYDVEKAKQLLADAGYPNGFKTTIWTSDNQQRIDIAEIMQNQLKNIGIDADVQIIEWGTFLVALQNKELDIYILGMTASTGDSEALYNQFHSTSPFSGNTAYYKNAKVDELLDKSRGVTTESDRLEVLEELQQLLVEEMPWVPVWHGETSIGMGKNVTGFVSHPTGNHRLVDAHFE